MRWKDLRRSSNVRDVRGAGGGGRMPLRIGRGGGVGGGLGLLVILGLAIRLRWAGRSPAVFSGGGGAPTSDQGQPLAANDEVSDFVARVLGSTEDVWGAVFAQSGERYQAPQLTLFAGAVQSACGYASSASGPFYCPGDQRVYLDTSFFDDLARMGGAGDFAAAYVIGHEVGHHVQTLLGTSDQVRAAQQRRARPTPIAYKLRWSSRPTVSRASGRITRTRPRACSSPATSKRGSARPRPSATTRLQRSAGRSVTPDSFTHGSSADRQRWLSTGLRTGDPGACDTFN